MELPREILDGGDDSRGGAVDGIADDGEAAVLNGIEQAPGRLFGESVKIMGAGVGMRGSEDKIVRLKANDFLEVHLRPIVIGIDDGTGSCFAQGIGDEGAFADGHEWLGPDDEKDARWRERSELLFEDGQPVLQIIGESLACVRNTEHNG